MLPVPRKVAQRYKEPEEVDHDGLVQLRLGERGGAGALVRAGAGFVRIRHFGTFAQRRCRSLLPLCRQLLAAAPLPDAPSTPDNRRPRARSDICGMPATLSAATLGYDPSGMVSFPSGAEDVCRTENCARRIRSKNGCWVSAEQDPGVPTETPGDWLGVRSRVFLIVGTWPV